MQPWQYQQEKDGYPDVENRPDYMDMHEARTALADSGILGKLDGAKNKEVIARWMFRENKTAEEAVEFFNGSWSE